MEEAPKGTFNEDLEWCIQKLETGLLRRNPTPRQVEVTQRVLRVLRSQNAPFVKKRQVMIQVFGNYRLKMSEERQAQEQAEPNVEEVTAGGTQSVAYKKKSTDVQRSAGHWFTPSNNDFTFNFFPDQEYQYTETPGDENEDHAEEVTCTDPPASHQGGAVCLDYGSEFTFNFPIREDPCGSSESSAAPLPTQDALGDHPSANHTAPADAQESLSQNSSNLDNAASTSGVKSDQAKIVDVVQTGAADCTKKKKKKSKSKNVVSPTQSKMEEDRGNQDPVPPQKEEPTSGADDLLRELDWCVEQLEMGIKRQKSSPKQMEEALRAIKTLRSEKVPLAKKRQVMRMTFGDYRQKMEEERIKQLRLMQAAAKSAKITEVTLTARQNSSKVVRKRSPKSSKSSADPADAPGSSDQATAPPSSSQQEFTFRPSEEPFRFNFF